MPKLSSCLHEHSPILKLQSLDNGRVGVVTTNNGCFLLDPEACSSNTHVKVDELKPTKHNVAFSPDGRYIAFAQYDPNAVRILDTVTRKVVRSYAVQGNPVELLSFDPTSTYIVAGTATGRVFVWRVDGTNILARLSSFPEYTPTLFATPTQNFVSAIAFSDTLVATTGYGGSIVVTNLHTQANTKRLKPSRARIDAMLFLDDKHIIAGNEDGIVESIHIEQHHPTRRIATSIGAIEHLVLLDNRHFVLAASRFHHIALINLKTMTVIDNRYITTPSPINSLTRTGENSLLIGLENGEIRKIELSPFAQFKQLISDGNYVQAYAMSDAEPIIKDSPEFTMLESIFVEHYQNALKALTHQNGDDAHHFLAPFKTVPSKSKLIQDLFNAFDHYPRLLHLIREKKYSIAYGLSVQFPPLQHAHGYKQMEKQWEKAFLEAQKLVITGHTQQAKDALRDYHTVSSKSAYIRLLLHHTPVIIAFSKALREKNFVLLKKLTGEHPILRDTPSYKTIIENAKEIIEEIMEAAKLQQFDKAELFCEELLKIPHLAHHHASTSRFILKAKKLDHYFRTEQMVKFYELLDHSMELSVLPQAKTMEESWARSMETCEEAALHGNTAVIKKELGALITLPTRSDKIGNLLRIGYQMQIKYHLSRKMLDQTAEAIINYIELFGIDNEIKNLITILDRQGLDLPLNEEQMQHRPRSLWLVKTQGGLPDNILEP